MTLIRVIPAVLRGVSGRCCLPETQFNFSTIDLDQHFGYVLGGSVVIESVFALGGLGTLLISSIRMKDTPVVMGAVMFITVAYSLVNLAVDLIYAFVDPRIKSQYAKGEIK